MDPYDFTEEEQSGFHSLSFTLPLTKHNQISEYDRACLSTAQPSQLSQPSSQKTKSSISQDRYCAHEILSLCPLWLILFDVATLRCLNSDL